MPRRRPPLVAAPIWVALIWGAVISALGAPIAIAAASPLQAWRDAAYVSGAMAGVIALSLLALQPLLAGAYLPGLARARAQWAHRRMGAALVLCVAAHIGGLYLSSPMDVMDALLLVSPTPFSIYGVAATVAVLAIGLLVLLRRVLRVRPALWRLVHNMLALIVVGATVVHAIMIDGAMSVASKWLIAGLALVATLAVTAHLRLFRRH